MKRPIYTITDERGIKHETSDAEKAERFSRCGFRVTGEMIEVPG